MPACLRGTSVLGHVLVAAWIASTLPGCAAVLPWGGKLEEQSVPAPEEPAAEEQQKPGSPAPPAEKEPGKEVPPPSSSAESSEPEKDPSGDSRGAAGQQELEQILDRLQQQGRLLPQQREKLAQDLALVDRSAWPILIQYFLASAQWTQQAEQTARGSKPPAERALLPPPGWPRQTTATKNDASASFRSAPRLSPAPRATAPQPQPAPASEDRKAVSGTGSEQTQRPQPQPVSPAASPNSGPTGTALAVDGPRPQAASEPPRQSLSPQQQLQRLIASLEQQTRGPARSLEELQRHVYLRMLYLLAGRKEEALEPIPGIPAPQQQYWTNQLYALAVYLDGEAISHSARRATEAKVHLDQAVYHLGTAGNLVVKNLAFCTAVRSYGVIGEFEQEEFRPGQVVLLYAELENFSTEETPEGYRTTLRGSYQIYDARGNQVASEELPVVEDVCRNRRRDFFVSYRIQLPQRIYPGRHKLQLTIEDAKSQRMATGTLEFTVSKQ